MGRAGTGWALAAAVAASAAPVTWQESTGVAVSAVRYYRPSSGQTLVDVFCRVPLALVAPMGGEGSDGRYRMSVVVRDSAGLQLVQQSWPQDVPARLLRAAGASWPEHFAFAAKAGRYTVDVAVTDSATGRVSRQQVVVTAFREVPRASDLLLGTGLRAVTDSADSARAIDEVRKGGVVVETSGEPVLTPQAARLGYYLELYAPQGDSVTVTVRVLDTAEAVVVTAARMAVAVGPGGGTTEGTLDLAGLPAGRYRLEVQAVGRVDTVSRRAPFGVTGFQTLATAAAVTQPADLFDRMGEPQLDELYGPLIYLMSSGEQGVYSSLSVEGKRSWLRQFWVKRDPTPGTPANEARERFYSAIREANRRFGEGGASRVPGWRTDRGRIFVKYGAPDEVLERRSGGSTYPYEVWKYTRDRALKYVFMDLTRFGNYTLIYTNDRREPSRANWQDLLGPEALQDVERF
jgi:GWxTD domain-containing protein